MGNLNFIKHSLIEGTLKENETIRYKSKLPRGNEVQLARLLVAFSNTNGGYLIIGVREKENGCEIIGVSETKKELTYYLDTIIYKYTTGVNYSLQMENIKGRDIAIVTI